ncbi:MAG: hypothetical protein AB203_03895 [Parcubacteria bacterium C7867-008]|nr:MAG: hypothetical protein AB203_03895 [Parcubacteria bacterium C7867-008]
MTRRILIIAAAIIVILGIAVAVYFFFFASKPSELIIDTDPFGNTGAGNIDGSGSLIEGQGAGTVVGPNFVRITEGPVALGVAAVDVMIPDVTGGVSTTSSSTPLVPDVAVRFIDRASGNIYSYVTHARTLTRISNKTLPGIQEASWVPDGSLVYARFITSDSESGEHIATYALPENGEGGYFIEQDLSQATVVGSTGLFTLVTSTGGSVGTIAKADSTGAKTLFTSLISSLIVYPSTGTYFAHTKASSQTDGYGFQITNGSFNRVLGPLRGLSLLPSPSGKSLLYNYVSGGVTYLAVIDLANRNATALPLATLSEKCVWASEVTVYCGVPTTLSGSAIPEDWYQGATTFSDRIWRIDMTARVATLVIDPTQVAKTSIDAVALTTDPKEDVLVFTDKRTGSLWLYDL